MLPEKVLTKPIVTLPTSREEIMGEQESILQKTAYVKTYYMKKIFIFYIIETKWEQVQTLKAVSIFDLGRMSPCLLLMGQN